MKPIDLILDTDLGADCDDMMALAYLVWATRQSRIRIRAVTHSNACAAGPAAIRAFFEYYGEAVPPIGRVVGEAKSYDNYCKAIVERFGQGDPGEWPDAVSVLRRALAESENAVICAVGPFTNIAALLQSKGDDISPLDGVALVGGKCQKLVVMAGRFDRDEAEWNAKLDASATKLMAELCPVPLVFLPAETGEAVITGGPIIEAFGESTPLSLSFCLFPGVKKRGGRPSWDPATAVYAVEGCREFFEESPYGTVTVDEEGKTMMSPNGMGKHRVLTMKNREGMTSEQCREQIAAYIDGCAMDVCGGRR